MDQKCPNCGLVNPPSTERCDCGWSFAEHKVGRGVHPVQGVGTMISGIVGGLFGAVVLGGGCSIIDWMVVRQAPHGFGCICLVDPWNLVDGLVFRVVIGSILGGAAGVAIRAVTRN